MNSLNGSSSRFGSPPAAQAPDAWQATRAQTSLATQIMGAEDAVGAEKPKIGRQISPTECELFVSCDPALAMQQQFEHLHPEFIAVHDIATASSRKLLVAIAAASGRVVQKLLIRRQGYGTPLAAIDFVELSSPDGGEQRMYSTEVEADSASRQGLAHVLLGFSRLAVVMVGDIPAHASGAALKPIQDAIVAGPWPNQQMLLLPLASGSGLMAQGAELGRGTGVTVRTTPQVVRPADAWGFINGSWARLRAGTPLDRRDPNSPGAKSRTGSAANRAGPAIKLNLEANGMKPMPPIKSAATRAAPAAPRGLLDRYVQQLIDLPGMASCCVFDVNSGQEVAHAGASPGAAELAMHGKALLATMSASSRKLGLGHALPEAAITLGSHHLLLRAVPGHPGLALNAALDKAQANLTLVRLQVQRMDSLLEGGGAPPA